jgi:serine/threonine protein kinase
LIHGDLKPSNIIQIDSKIKLIDLDASANYFSGQYIGSKVSTGIIPPELLCKRGDGRIIIRTFKFDPWTKMPVADHEGYIYTYIYVYIYSII